MPVNDPGTSPTDDPLDAREQELMDVIADEADSPLSLRVSDRGGIPVVAADGELDIATAPALQERLKEALAANPRGLVVDLSRTLYIDSKGLAVLLQASRSLPGAVAVVTPQERIARLFRATGLSERLHLHGTLAEALAGLEKE